MSTRATYLLPAGDISQPICFYIHYDGYLEGAAHYFYKMHQCKNKRSALAGRFFRANAYAEFTRSHETHGDTEYQYTINYQGILSVRQKESFNGEWRSIYEGLWYEFVNQYLTGAEHLYAFKLSNYSERATIMTIAEAKTYVRAFDKNSKQQYYFLQHIEAVQAQIDEILLKKTDPSPLSSRQFSSVDLPWEEQFALFSVELEAKIAVWVKENAAKYFGWHHPSAAEKLEQDFGLFFDSLIEAWAYGSCILAGGTLAFDFRRASNLLYVCMVEKYGRKLQEAIKAAKKAYSNDTEDY